MKYLTEYTKKDGLYGGEVYADSWEEAEDSCIKRGLNETVIGYVPEDYDESTTQNSRSASRSLHNQPD